MMRKIQVTELQIIKTLSKVADLNVDISFDQSVWEINPTMGAIRSCSCPKGVRVKPVSYCEYTDTDGVPVIITLLLASDGTFGELDFWKVTDQPVVGGLPVIEALKNFNSSKLSGHR